MSTNDMSIYTNIDCCRICDGTRLPTIMAFGAQFLASAFVKDNSATPLSKIKVPMTVVQCDDCGTVQLKENVDRNVLFHDYFYRSGTNPMMRDALKDVVDSIMQRAPLRDGDAVLDIGCNDATMLMFYPDTYKRVGIDPASNIDWAHAKGHATLYNDFFSKQLALEATGGTKYRAISTIAMLYNMDNLRSIVRDIKSVLADDGVWCIQVSYLPDMLDTLSFYDVCHEHLYYFSLQSLGELLSREGITMFDAARNAVNGGSIRIYATHAEANRAPTETLQRFRADEAAHKLGEKSTYDAFMARVEDLKVKVCAYLRNEQAHGKLVIGLGASTKGNVLLQYFGIDKTLLPYISERNPDKCGLRTLGTDIEVISEEKARELGPSAMLVLIWFFKEELLRREHAYLAQGGAMLFPMPFGHVVTSTGERPL